jgi:hypothetical protein
MGNWRTLATPVIYRYDVLTAGDHRLHIATANASPVRMGNLRRLGSGAYRPATLCPSQLAATRSSTLATLGGRPLPRHALGQALPGALRPAPRAALTSASPSRRQAFGLAIDSCRSACRRRDNPPLHAASTCRNARPDPRPGLRGGRRMANPGRRRPARHPTAGSPLDRHRPAPTIVKPTLPTWCGWMPAATSSPSRQRRRRRRLQRASGRFRCCITTGDGRNAGQLCRRRTGQGLPAGYQLAREQARA